MQATTEHEARGRGAKLRGLRRTLGKSISILTDDHSISLMASPVDLMLYPNNIPVCFTVYYNLKDNLHTYHSQESKG